tara:strand:- start:897 stop:1988 length:1092 start_codon:yes stop_codon:yes gene_type:complete
MKNKILILGSTGKLGTKLLDYCLKNHLQISALTCYTNIKKINKLKVKFNVKNTFCLSIKKDELTFLDYLKNNNFTIVYFLDYGSYSLKYLNIILNNNTKCILGIANKELLIAGGRILINKINFTKNSLIPLDSEHFSLLNSNNNNNHISELYITASGGPFYFKKKLNLNNVSLSQVLAHPKWSMGMNNSIDSSNFINKILEIYEMSSIYNIDLEKINFLISKEAFVHSIIIYKDNTISLNCFKNNMLLALIKPLTILYKSKELRISSKDYLNINNFKIQKFSDKRFRIFKYFKYLRSLDHSQQILFMILNNIAQKKYLNGNLKYNNIIDFIMNSIFTSKINKKLHTIDDILRYTDLVYKIHDK